MTKACIVHVLGAFAPRVVDIRGIFAFAKIPLLFALVACKGGGEPPGVTSSGPAATGTVASTSAAADPAPSASAAPPDSAPAKGQRPEIQGVLFLSIDSLRADMPWAGYPRDIAPRLTALEKTCVSYTNAYSVSSYTAQSVAAFLASRLPSELSRDGYFFQKYAAGVTFFPELLQKAGVFTAAAQAHGYFKRAGFEQGFDQWELVPNLIWDATTDKNITGPKHAEIAMRMLVDPEILEKKRKFFEWFHLMDPHDLYQTHEKDGIEPLGKKPRDRYDNEVQFTDVQIGKILDHVKAQPYADKIAILISSDHGEAFGEHGRTRHAFELWQSLVRVPLMLCLPGAAPQRIDVPRSGIDIGPTVLELLGVPASDALSGKSLVAEAYGTAKPEERDVVLDLARTSTNGQRRALIHGKHKIIQFDGSITKTFDLEADPEEAHELTGEVRDDMRARLKETNAAIKDVPTTVCGKGCLEGTKN